MALPMNPCPTYTLTIPSTKKQLKYRPFLVREQKSLLIAQQSEQDSVMIDTIKEVIKTCAQNDVDVDKLASFDIEYIFLQLRAASVGEFVELFFKCDDSHEGDPTIKVPMDVREAKVEEFAGHTNKITLFNNVGVVMKYPNVDTLKKINTANDDEFDQVVDIVIDCIDYIYDADEVYAASDHSKQELVEFLNNLTSEQFEKIRKFFITMPKLRLYFKYTCPVCAKQYDRYVEGLSSFF